MKQLISAGTMNIKNFDISKMLKNLDKLLEFINDKDSLLKDYDKP